MPANKKRVTANRRRKTYKTLLLSLMTGLLFVISLSGSMTSGVYAYDPHFRLPWAPGASFAISGYSYGIETHMVDRGCNYDFDGVQVWGGAGTQ